MIIVSVPKEEQNLNWLIIRVVSLTLDYSIASSVNNWQSVLNSTRFEFESGDHSTNGSRIPFFEIVAIFCEKIQLVEVLLSSLGLPS